MPVGGGGDADFWKILYHSVECGGLGITDPRLPVESVYNTSKSACGGLVGSLLGGINLNYVGHRSCICRESVVVIKDRDYLEMSDMDRLKELVGGQYRQRLHGETINGVWISAIPHRLKITELSREEFRDNICLIYGITPQDINTKFDD